MPCWAPNGFADGTDAIADSGGIAKHFLAPSATDAAVMEQCGGLFKGIAMLLKHTDDAKDGELIEGLNDQLDKLEACAFAPYLSGAAPGLADAFIHLRLPFDSDGARELNNQIFETMYHAALECSCELAKAEGHYESYAGSPVSNGVLQYDMWGVKPSARWDCSP